MNKTFKANDKGELEVKVTYEEPDWRPLVGKAERLLAEKVSIPGFRKGKVPLEEARRYLKAEDIYDKMFNLMYRESLKTLLEGDTEQHSVAYSIAPTVVPAFDQKANTYSLTYSLVLSPSAKIGAYSGLKVEVAPRPVGEKQVAERLEALRQEQGVLEEQEGEYAAEQGDICNINAIGYVDNRSFEGGDVKAYDLELGSHSFVPGFEDQLIGVKTGERRRVAITFPENYIKEYANKPAVFDVTVNSIKKKVYPELDDEFAKSVPNFQVSSLDELKKALMEQLQQAAKAQLANETYEAILQKIGETAEYAISERFIDEEFKNRLANQLNQVKQYGISYEDFLAISNVSQEHFEQQLREQARADVRRFALIQAVISAAKIDLKDEDYVQYFGSQEAFDDFKKNFEEQTKNDAEAANTGLRQLNNTVLGRKVFNFLLEQNPLESAPAKKAPAAKKPAAAADKPAESVDTKKAPTAAAKKKPAAKKTAEKKED